MPGIVRAINENQWDCVRTIWILKCLALELPKTAFKFNMFGNEDNFFRNVFTPLQKLSFLCKCCIPVANITHELYLQKENERVFLKNIDPVKAALIYLRSCSAVI